jgi:predicted dehydrogenase
VSVGILGSGFGLYGYLPAVIEGCRQVAVLPDAYRRKLQSRPELQHLESSIRWARDEDDLACQVDTLILARRPEDHVLWLEQNLSYPELRCLLLEKPIAPDPASAGRVLDTLRESGSTYRIGFNFGLTDWASRMRAELGAGRLEAWSIVWDFRAHHYANDLQTWKRFPSQGGGALRFFGIHIVAFLAELGYSQAAYSRIRASAEDEAEQWGAEVIGDGLPPCTVAIDSNAFRQRFALEANPRSADRRHLVDQSDPFEGVHRVGNFDRRASIITAMLRDLMSGTPPYWPWYERSVALWAALERMTERMAAR